MDIQIWSKGLRTFHCPNGLTIKGVIEDSIIVEGSGTTVETIYNLLMSGF